MPRKKGDGQKGWGGASMNNEAGQYDGSRWDGKSLPPAARKLYEYLKTHPTFSIADYRRAAECTWKIARHPFDQLRVRGLIVRRVYWDVFPVPFGDEEINKGVYVKGRWADDAQKLWRIPKSLRRHRNSPSKINADITDAKEYIINSGLSNSITRDDLLDEAPTEEELMQALFEYRLRQIERGEIIPHDEDDDGV